MRLPRRPCLTMILLTVFGVLLAAVIVFGPVLREPFLAYERDGPGYRYTLQIEDDGRATSTHGAWRLTPQRMAELNSQSAAADFWAFADYYSGAGGEAEIFVITVKQGIFHKTVESAYGDDSPPALVGLRQSLEELRQEVEQNRISPSTPANP